MSGFWKIWISYAGDSFGVFLIEMMKVEYDD